VLTLKTPAKVNLTLEILGKRPDGFHELRSVLQAVGMYDTLYFEEARRLNVTGTLDGWIPGDSLVTKAAELMRKKAGVRKGADIRVEKTIPLLSGLGGDSSDAAAALLGLNQLWSLGWERERLAEIAAELGSDVAFFVFGGTALAEGRGERITLLPALPRRWVVLMLPDVAPEKGKTAQMYASLRTSHFTDGQTTRRLVEVLVTRLPFRPTMLVNNFENVAFATGSVLKVYREHIDKLGAPFVHLCGSGPSLYTMFADKAQADDLAVRCMNQGLRAYVISTL
jgi:4-diphosphocytidyl-2-C-methyl-D-erythritol kinase